MTAKRLFHRNELSAGQARSVVVDDERILICHVDDGKFFAVADCCSHDGGALGQGTLDGTVVECPRHGARFDVSNGRAVRMPAIAPIETFDLTISADGWIELDLEEAQ